MLENLISKIEKFHEEYKHIYDIYVRGYLDSNEHKSCTLQDVVFDKDYSSVVKALKKMRSSLGYIMSYKHNVYKFKEEDLKDIDVTPTLLESCLDKLDSIDFDKLRSVVESCVRRLEVSSSLHVRLTESSYSYRYSNIHREYIRYNILLNYIRLVTIFYPLCMLVNLEDNIKSQSNDKVARIICDFLTDLTWMELLKELTSESADNLDAYLQYLYKVEGTSDTIAGIIKDGKLRDINESIGYFRMAQSSKFHLVKLLCDTYSY